MAFAGSAIGRGLKARCANDTVLLSCSFEESSTSGNSGNATIWPKSRTGHNPMPRSVRFLLLGSVFGAVLIAGILAAATRRSSASTKSASTAASAPVAASTTTTPSGEMVAPPGTVLYVAKKGDTMATLVRLYFADSSYITLSEFENAVRERNGDFKGAFLKPGANMIVPGMDNPI